MKRHRQMTTAIAALAIAGCAMATAQAHDNDNDDNAAITARLHGTFQDNSGGLGVLSGDIFIVRFEVRNGAVTALGQIVGAMADSAGNPLGRVNQAVALPVGNVASTCNQIRMDLAATDAEVLQRSIHFDKEVAGFDSREGTGMVPKALGVLCAAQELLRGTPSPDALAQALNDVATAAAAAQSR